jgi:hypothetical protein
VTTASIESPLSLFAEASRSPRAGGRPTTLEERLDATWGSLRHGGAAECPICHTSMRLDGGIGRCPSCGSNLS